MTNLKNNLRALAICYRMIGGFVALLVSAFTVIVLSRAQVGNGITNLLARLSSSLLFILPLVAVVIIGAAVTLVLFEVASSLHNREHRVFCLVVGWLMCASFPLGTVLGVFTILQLTRPEAQSAFAESSVPETQDQENFQTGAEPGVA